MTYPPPPGQSPYPSAPPPEGGGFDGTPKRLRGRIPLRLALIFGVLGIVLIVVGAVVLAKKSLGTVNDFGRVSISSGSGTVTFSHTGSYLAYYEADDVTSNIDRVPLPAVTLISPSGATKNLTTLYGGGTRGTGNISTRLTYDYNNHKGVAIYQYKITEKGKYQVQISGASNTAPGSKVAFGKSIAGGLVVGVALVIPGVLLVIAAVVLLIVGLVKRSRHKKQLAGFGGYGGGYGGGAPPPNYPPQGGQAYPPQGGQAYPPQPGGQQPPPPGAWPSAPGSEPSS